MDNRCYAKCTVTGLSPHFEKQMKNIYTNEKNKAQNLVALLKSKLEIIMQIVYYVCTLFLYVKLLRQLKAKEDLIRQ